jgi:hypothetical protein
VTTGLFDHDYTRSDIQALVTTTTRTVSYCTAPGDCGPLHTETGGEVTILPAMGIEFIDPDGHWLYINPAENTAGFPNPPDLYATEFKQSVRLGKTDSQFQVSLPGGGTRTISWAGGAGTIEVTDRLADATTSTATLHSGDVVPLIPGTLTDQPKTRDKAVTFDLPGGDYMISIFPAINETSSTSGLPGETASRYGLTPQAHGTYAPTLDSSGGKLVVPA